MDSLKTFVVSGAALALASVLGHGNAVAADAKTCKVMGKEVVWKSDEPCPQNVIATLKTLRIERLEPKLDSAGKPVLDPKTGKPEMVKAYDTFTTIAGLLERLDRSKHPTHTVFAPPDRAFEAQKISLDQGTEEKKKAVWKLAATHCIDEPMDAAWFGSSNGQIWTMAGSWSEGGKPLRYNLLGDNRTVHDAQITKMDVKASDGVIHVVDKVLTN